MGYETTGYGKEDPAAKGAVADPTDPAAKAKAPAAATPAAAAPAAAPGAEAAAAPTKPAAPAKPDPSTPPKGAELSNGPEGDGGVWALTLPEKYLPAEEKPKEVKK